MSTLNVNNVNEVGGASVIASGVLDSGSLPAGSVLQVVSTTKTDTFTTTSLTWGDVTGLSASITPLSTSSKILIIASLEAKGASGSNGALTRIMRDATPIAISDAAGSREQSTSMVEAINGATLFTAVNYLDTPATTSTITYKWQARNNVSGQTIYVNRTISDTDSSVWGRAISSITLMEIAG